MADYTQEDKRLVELYMAHYGCGLRAAQTARRRQSAQWREFLKLGAAENQEESVYTPGEGVRVARKNAKVCWEQYEKSLELVKDLLEQSKKNKCVVKSLKEGQLAISRAQDLSTRARKEVEDAMRSAGELVAWSELENLASRLGMLGQTLRDLPELVSADVAAQERAHVAGLVENALIDKVNPLLESIISELSRGH